MLIIDDGYTLNLVMINVPILISILIHLLFTIIDVDVLNLVMINVLLIIPIPIPIIVISTFILLIVSGQILFQFLFC